jgi:hypothetical protein
VLGLMERYATVVLLALAASGCASSPDKPRLCFVGEPPVAPITPSEQKAVRFVEHHIGSSCRAAGVECNLALHRRPNGQIAVTASRALLEGSPPHCTRLDGGFETYLFSPEGKYERVELGL